MLYSQDFRISTGHHWLNAASEGPIPTVAVNALNEAVVWKSSPHLLTIPKFQQIPLELKSSIAELCACRKEDITLGNSATYGIHLLANGLDLKPGDDIILMHNDFPTNILPWLSLEQKGISVRQIKPTHYVLTVQEIDQAIKPTTRLVCLSLIHSFSGHAINIDAIVDACHKKGVLIILNLSQALGAFPIDIPSLRVDAIVCAGYKWLLGPYGTGFCWINESLRLTLNYPQNYWISLMDEQSLSSEIQLTLNDCHLSKRYDVFGTANFFNYVPWTASIKYLLNIGLKNVLIHNQALVNAFVDNLNLKLYDVISPYAQNERTNIIVFSHKSPEHNTKIFDLLKSKGYYLGFWKNKIRVSPHIYNTQEEIKRLVTVLNSYGT